MLVVPLKNDRIVVEDNDTDFVITSYSNFKAEPAVYIDSGDGTNNVVYFQDIIKINGVKVEYNETSKVFDALGPLKRKYNLPQKGDTIFIDDEEDKPAVEVKGLKLHNRAQGINRGLLVVSKDGDTFELSDITMIDRKIGSDSFDASKFQKLYFDYLPYRSRKPS